MTYRIGWVSPLTPKSGIGSFSKAVLESFPSTLDGEDIDVTVFYVDHALVYSTCHRAVKIIQNKEFREILSLFDLLIYNIGNNREHHEPVYELLQIYPGLIVCHDYVYQHYLADRCVRASRHFAGYAALLRKFSDGPVGPYIRRSQITSRTGRIRYSPWDTPLSVLQPMSESILSLGSALVVHSSFSRRHVETHFEGPILQLGMPYDLRPATDEQDRAVAGWEKAVSTKPVLDLVSFGHIQPQKCIELVLDAIASSEGIRSRLRYTIAGFIGDQVYLEELRSRVDALGLTSVVCFETALSDVRLDALMVKADLFVNLRQPNTEASSLSLVEQLGTGRPVIVFDSGCYAEVPDGAALKLPQEPLAESSAPLLRA